MQKSIKQQKGQWKYVHAKAFLKWVKQQVKQNKDDNHIARVLGLLAHILYDHWDMHLIYALSCPSHNELHHPFGFLSQLSRDSSRRLVQSATCLCLAAVWQALSSLDKLVTPPSSIARLQDNTVWWISCLQSSENKESYWSDVVQWCNDQWLLHDVPIVGVDAGDGEEEGAPSKEITKHAACILLYQLLQNQSTSSWLYEMPESIWCSFAERLIEQSQRLLDPNMPMTSFARLSLVSLLLLAKVDQSAAKEMPLSYELLTTGNGNGGLVMTMMKSTFQDTMEDCPRWAEAANTFIIPILHEWSKIGKLTSYWEMDTRRESLRFFVKMIVERVLGRSLIKHTLLASFLWLLRETPALCRNVIQTVVSKDRWCDFIGSLIAMIVGEDHRTVVVPVCALREILYLVPYKNVDATRPSSIQNFIDKTNSFVKEEDMKSLLLVHLDCAQALFSKGCLESVDTFQSFMQVLHSYVFVNAAQVTKNKIRQDSDSCMDSLESTPTANNLSRLDVSCIDVEEVEQNSTKSMPYGLELCIRIAVSTLQATILTTNTARNDIKSQVYNNLSEFITSCDMAISTDGMNRVSSGWLYRKGTLLRLLALADDSSLYYHAFTNIESSRTCELQQMRKDVEQKEGRIYWLENREKQLTQEATTREAHLNAQSTLALRERNILYRKLTTESRQSLETEIAKRAELQEQCDNLRGVNQDLDSSLKDLEAETNLLRSHSRKIEAELSEKTQLYEKLKLEINDMRNTLAQKKECETKLSKQVELATASIAEYKVRESQLRDQIAQNKQTIDEVQGSREEMHATLESLFGDMVSLARAYELKEKEVSSSNESKEKLIEKLEKEVKRERQQRKELEDKYRQVEYDNEALSRKYARTREKLEEERRSQNRSPTSSTLVKPRVGSKSYIQQLQLSSSSSRSSSSRHGKENDVRSTKSGNFR
jgi:hypothetical protein